MEHISVKKKIDRLIITHKIEKNEQINSMELDIINRTEIPALLPVQIHRALTGKEFRFVVQNLTDLRSFLKSDIRFELFAQIVLQIVDTLQACESHGIRCSNLELNCDLSFYDYSQRKVRLVYWPLISLDAYTNIPAYFMELGSIYITRGHDSDYRLEYLKFFDNRAKFDLDGFKIFVEKLMKRWKDGEEPTSSGDNRGKKKPEGILPTVGLMNASILRKATQTTIQILRYPFTIGRNSNFCDYAVEDNPYVSKRHVTILLRNGQIYIRDNGSANGTYVDGIRLAAHVDTELQSGAAIQIGKEDFVFYAAGG